MTDLIDLDVHFLLLCTSVAGLQVTVSSNPLGAICLGTELCYALSDLNPLCYY